MSTSLSPSDSVIRDGPGGRDGSERPSKRLKVAVACDECRTKKIKCDGSRPVCQPCRNRRRSSSECTWGVRNVRSSGVSKKDLQQLEKRIKELEAEKRDADLFSVNDAPGDRQVQSRQSNLVSRDKDYGAMMGILASEEDAQGANIGLIGDSGATSLLNQVKLAINRNSGQTPEARRPSFSIIGRDHRTLFMSRNKGQRPGLDYVLPPRKRADELLEVYWRLVDPLYPFLDKPELMAAYQALWTGDGPGYDERTFLCLLNVIFSLACVLGGVFKFEERSASADVFFERSRELLDLDLVQKGTVLTVQCFLLLGQYLQSTNEPQQCWTFVGLAVRTAQSLGLHLPSTSSGVDDLKQRELLRRVWHGCVLMDRALAMTFGRPAMITTQAAASVPRPLAQSDDGNPSNLHFFIESLDLYDILNEILLSLYTPSAEEESNDPYTIYFRSSGNTPIASVFELDRRLLLWQQNLPDHLRAKEDANKSHIHIRQSNVLSLRFRHIRMLLLRPTLALFCIRHGQSASDIVEDALPYKLALHSSVMAVKIAQEVVDIFLSKLSSEKRLDDVLPAWWYNVFYVYTAATVLVAARLHPAITAEISHEAIQASWQGALGILTRLQAFSKNVVRVVAALKAFDRMPEQYQQQQQQQDGQNQHPSSHDDQTQISTEPQYTGSAISAPAVPQPVQPNFVSSLSTTGDSSSSPSSTMWRFPEIAMSSSSSSYPAISVPAPPQQQQSPLNMPFINDLDFSFDLNDMSWLNSVPFQLYGD